MRRFALIRLRRRRNKESAEARFSRTATSARLTLTYHHRMMDCRTVDSSSGPLIEKHVKRHDPAVPRDDEVSPGVSRHFTRASRYPWNHPCIAIFLRSVSHLISKVRVSRLDGARDAIDLVAATNGSLAGIVEDSIFGP